MALSSFLWEFLIELCSDAFSSFVLNLNMKLVHCALVISTRAQSFMGADLTIGRTCFRTRNFFLLENKPKFKCFNTVDTVRLNVKI